MPRNWKKRTKRKPRLYGTKAKFMPRGLAQKKYGQVGTKCFYFKKTGTINSGTDGVSFFTFRTYDGQIASTTNPQRFPSVADSDFMAVGWTEYKVLALKVRLFAANVGSEGGQLSTAGLSQFAPGFNRGNAVMYIDQEVQKNEVLPTQIVNVMNRGSCRMIPARSSQYTKVMYRKKGVPEWGCCDRNVEPEDRNPDPWVASIEYLGNNATTTDAAGVRPLWFYTVTYKILFRGRNFVIA